MIKAIIVDDERHCSDRIVRLIQNYCATDVEIVDVCSNIDVAHKAICNLKPDVVFLDVQIRDETGFDLLRRFDKIDFEVIFSTAFEKYAVQAFRFSAVDYLLKPVDPDEFVSTVNKLKMRVADAERRKDLDVASANFDNLRLGKLTIPTSEGKEIFNIADIVHCEASGNYTIFNFKGRKPFKDTRTLKRYEEVLVKHGFYRIHSAHLVNLSHIRRFENGKNSFVVLNDDTKLPVSTRKKDYFLRRLSQL